MISRRLIRTKILQILYAFYQKKDNSLAQAENELFYSLHKAYDLYHLLLLIPVELAHVNATKIELGKQKLRPTYEDLHPKIQFCQNKIIKLIENNKQLKNYIEGRKISWVNYREIFKGLFQIIEKKNYFKEYLNIDQPTFQDDKKIVVQILENEIFTYEAIEVVLEEMSVFWNDDIDFVLAMVIKTIRNLKERDSIENKLMPMYRSEEDVEFARKLLHKSIFNKDIYDQLIKNHLKNWEFDRIALIDMLLMQLSLTEILEFPSIPIKVSLNEYIDLAKIYSTANSNNFINGILDNIVKELKSKNKIFKTGKGLIET